MSTHSPPKHIAIIMDGNGRWAQERGLPRREGHAAGAESVREVVEAARQMGVKYLTLYAFSTENWKRPQSEITALMALLERFLKQKTKDLKTQNIRLHVIGRTHMLPKKIQKQLNQTLEETQHNTAFHLVLALSYGSREEITDTLKNLAQQVQRGELDPKEITSDLITNHLDTAPFPDPELLIRTSGEARLSNFLLWQLSYAELYLTKTHWPDFRKKELYLAVQNYQERTRRFGGL